MHDRNWGGWEFPTGKPGLFFSLILCLLLSAGCNTYKEGREVEGISLFNTGPFHYQPGEVLEFEANAGPVTVGSVTLKVDQKSVWTGDGICVHLQADAYTKEGFSWMAEIRHHWESWVDSSTGLSRRMWRKVQENRYRAEQHIDFYPDSQKIAMVDLHKAGKPRRVFAARPEQMSDLVNTMWKFRYSDFSGVRTGDTLRYLTFFDGDWLVFQVRFGGEKILKWGGKKHPAYVLYPVGIQSGYLRGKEPAEIWIEKGVLRRPFKVRVATYFGNMTLLLRPSSES